MHFHFTPYPFKISSKGSQPTLARLPSPHRHSTRSPSPTSHDRLYSHFSQIPRTDSPSHTPIALLSHPPPQNSKAESQHLYQGVTVTHHTAKMLSSSLPPSLPHPVSSLPFLVAVRKSTINYFLEVAHAQPNTFVWGLFHSESDFVFEGIEWRFNNADMIAIYAILLCTIIDFVDYFPSLPIIELQR